MLLLQLSHLFFISNSVVFVDVGLIGDFSPQALYLYAYVSHCGLTAYRSLKKVNTNLKLCDNVIYHHIAYTDMAIFACV